jgi:lysine-specific demethylase 3
VLTDTAVPAEDCAPGLRELRVNIDGSIPCPPNAFGGCGDSVLELKSLLEENVISNLLDKANLVINSEGVLEVGGSKCSCFSDFGEMSTCTSRKLACRENSRDNYIYCPNARDVKNGDLDHFQEHWLKGQPVIVRDVLESTSKLSWEPMVMWRAVREKREQEEPERLSVTALECLSWSEVTHIMVVIVYTIKLLNFPLTKLISRITGFKFVRNYINCVLLLFSELLLMNMVNFVEYRLLLLFMYTYICAYTVS